MRCIKNVMEFTYATRLLTCILVLYPVHHTINTSKLKQYVISDIKLCEVLPQSQCTPAMTKMLLELFSHHQFLPHLSPSDISIAAIIR